MELYSSSDISLWNTSLAAYKEVVSLVERDRKKKSTSKNREAEKLTTLDKWYGCMYVCEPTSFGFNPIVHIANGEILLVKLNSVNIFGV